MHAYFGRIPLDFVLSVPVISSLVKQNSAPVSVDVDPMIVRPRLIREKSIKGLEFHARESFWPTVSAIRRKPNLRPKANRKGKRMTFFCPRGMGGD